MRVAFFTPYLPYPPDTGGKTRSYHLLRALAERAEVDLFTVVHGPEPSSQDQEALRQLCRKVFLYPLVKSWRTRDRLRRSLATLPRSVDYFHTADSLAQARRDLAAGGYDVLAADEICMTPYAELLPNTPRVVLRQKVDHQHYREIARSRPWGTDKVLDSLEAAKLRRYERLKMPLYDAFIACTEADAAIIRRDVPQMPYLVVPNGADLSSFSPAARQPGEPVLLYVGAMHYYPNIDAVHYFFETMFDRIREAVPNTQVQIVGHSPPHDIQEMARQPGIQVTGSVDDVRPYYSSATVFVVPLRLGGGTRLKIIEAMAMGLPVVSTSVGAEGLDLRDGQDILLANDPISFADATVRLLTDPGLRQHLAQNARQAAQRYDWDKLSEPWVELVLNHASGNKGQ